MTEQNRTERRREDNSRRTWNQVRVKINGPSSTAVSEIQEALAQAFGHRAILSPVLPSESYGRSSGFHAFVTVTEELK